jgi:hypothetical protein
MQYLLPSAVLGVRGLEYFIEISSGQSTAFVGGATEPYAFVVELSNAQAQRPTPTTAGKYRIIGLPVTIQGSSTVTSVFADDLGTAYKDDWRLGSYSSTGNTVTEYPAAANAAPGQGYWLITRNAKTYGSAGTSMRPNFEYGGKAYYSVPLDTAWNQLANPLPFNVAWNDVLIDTGGIVLSGHPVEILENVLYWYNGTGYSTVATIPAWDGVFVRTLSASTNVTAHFPYSESTKKSPKPLLQLAGSQSPDDWSIHIQMESNDLIDDGNLAGVRSDALTGSDFYDFSEPPPAPEAPFMAFRLPDKSHLRRCDYRPPFKEGEQWHIELSAASGRTLEITDLDQIPNGMASILVLDNGSKIHLSNGIRIVVPDNVKTALLAIGTKEYIENGNIGPLPNQFTLEQNYPNPFNPMTHIRFALPLKGEVSLEVYNIIGRKVTTLYTGYLEAGYHTVSWDGTDGSGREVASGIYFYRLTSNNFTGCRKMIMLK